MKVRSIVDCLDGVFCHVIAPGGVAICSPPVFVISSSSLAGSFAWTWVPSYWGWWRLKSPRRIWWAILSLVACISSSL